VLVAAVGQDHHKHKQLRYLHLQREQSLRRRQRRADNNGLMAVVQLQILALFPSLLLVIAVLALQDRQQQVKARTRGKATRWKAKSSATAWVLGLRVDWYGINSTGAERPAGSKEHRFHR